MSNKKRNILDEQTGERYSLEEFNKKYPKALKNLQDSIQTEVSNIQKN